MAWVKDVYVTEICAEGIFVSFSFWLGNVKVGQKWPFFFQMSAILKFDFQKEFNYSFQKIIILTTQKRQIFAYDNYIFRKIRENKNKQ